MGAIGCATSGTHFEWQDVERLRPGMSERDVVAILGRPYMVATGTDGTDTLTWSWASASAFGGVSSRAVSLRFEDGKLLAIPRTPDSVAREWSTEQQK